MTDIFFFPIVNAHHLPISLRHVRFFGFCLQSREKKNNWTTSFYVCISGLVCLLFTSFDGRVRKKKMGGGTSLAIKHTVKKLKDKNTPWPYIVHWSYQSDAGKVGGVSMILFRNNHAPFCCWQSVCLSRESIVALIPQNIKASHSLAFFFPFY